MKKTAIKGIVVAAIGISAGAALLVSTMAISATPTPTKAAQEVAINLNMIYMPGKGNGVCNEAQGAKDSCMATVAVVYGDGVKREDFGVFIGNDLIATNIGLVTGRSDGHAVKPGDKSSYTIVFSDGSTRKAVPWAFVPGNVAVLKMK